MVIFRWQKTYLAQEQSGNPKDKKTVFGHLKKRISMSSKILQATEKEKCQNWKNTCNKYARKCYYP